MKKLLILPILFAFVVGVSGSVLANKKEEADIQFTSATQFCNSSGNLGYSSFGECISIFKTSYSPGKSGPVGVCKEFLNKDPDQFYDRYNNLDECVNFLRTGYVHE